MRNFAICLLVLNLAYLAWNLELIPGSQSQEQVLIRNPSQQAPQSLVLLSELDELPAPRQAQDAAPAESGATEPATDNNTAQLNLQTDISGENIACMAVGSFADLNEGNELLAALLEQGFQANLQMTEQTESEYRVYMPPFNSDAAARQTLVSLLESGIDSFIINDGDLARGISLGVFTQENSAYGLQEELASQGYATSIQQIIRSNTEFWVVIRSSSAEELQALWLTLLEVRNSLNQSENLCEIIAPEV
ncbi:MAG: hypothetical protein CMP91_02980 [Gammaproteobacteria bacterium]|nr:hypothetical protein [Gammaproteobacteria bacterium]MAY02376.1 hypothetical protein [Gammaproteobacteria bacterium]|tara:strand:- start:1935 stop:2684 length:750 start_codon:yes stop_codon:yes gene_type:complete